MPNHDRPISRHMKPAAMATAFMLLILTVLLSCSEETPIEPESTETTVTGYVEFPDANQVDIETIDVAFGDSESSLDESGDFVLTGNGDNPGLAMAYGDDEIPLLMAVVPNPGDAETVILDTYSTAIALVFLNPFVCTSDVEDAEEIIERLEGLPELYTLELILYNSLITNPEALQTRDAELDTAIDNALTAYLNSYASTIQKSGDLLNDTSTGTVAASSNISIIPSYEISGHQLTQIGRDRYKISNSIGRWAYCLTPDEDFYLFPNGSLLDIFKGAPWAASERAFTMEVPFGEPEEVSVYGLGWAEMVDSSWDDLLAHEQEYVINAGMTTVLIEFVPQLISVVTNTSTTFGRGSMDKAKLVRMLGFLNQADIMAKCKEHIRAGDPVGLIKYLTETTIKKFISDSQFRATVVSTFGISMSAGALSFLDKWIKAPLRIFLTADAVTSSVKTAMGFYNSQFCTTFEIWNEALEVGNVSGFVYDGETNIGLAGAEVVLEGDDGNPLNPMLNSVSSSTGTYYFGNIRVGSKTISASKTGYQSSSVTVVIAKDVTVTAPPLVLSPITSVTSGRVLDGILQNEGYADPTFTKRLNMRVTQQDGDFDEPYTVNNGDYTYNLSPGTYLIKASHEDYSPDSITVTVTESGSSAARDLVLHPKGSMSGTLQLDLNGDGTYESSVNISAAVVGARISSGGVVLDILALVGMDPSSDVIQLHISLDQVQQVDIYPLGSALEVTRGTGTAAGVFYGTRREICIEPETQQPSSLWFDVSEDPDEQECNCGISDFGNLYISEPYSTELTDLVSCSILAELAGSYTCGCSCCVDLNGDGEEEEYLVDCVRAKLNLNFKVLIGSMYLIPGTNP
jgi:Carboxypeptidase regulatory-like domain